MIDIIFESLFKGVFSIIEKGILGVFGLVEIVYSDNSNEKYALVVVVLFTLAVATLWYVGKDYYEQLKIKKRKKNSKIRTKKVATRRMANSSAKKTASKKNKTTVKKNKATVKTTRKGETRIKTGKEIQTPGVKKTRNKAV